MTLTAPTLENAPTPFRVQLPNPHQMPTHWRHMPTMEDHEWNGASYAELPRMTTDRPPSNTLTPTKTRDSMNVDLSGLYRMGRICRSIFDRKGRTQAYGPYPVDITHNNRGSTGSNRRRSSDDSYKTVSSRGSGSTFQLSRTSSSGSTSSRSERKNLAKKLRK